MDKLTINNQIDYLVGGLAQWGEARNQARVHSPDNPEAWTWMDMQIKAIIDQIQGLYQQLEQLNK